MKNLIILIMSIAYIYSVDSQNTLIPATGDRITLYLNGNVWETVATEQTELSLMVCRFPDNYKTMWILDFGIGSEMMEALSLNIRRLPNVRIEKGWTIDDQIGRVEILRIYYCEDEENCIRGNIPDLFYTMDKIRAFLRPTIQVK